MTDYIYDIETYKNCFTCYIGNAETRRCKGFEISFRKDQREEFFDYLRMIYKTKGRMVGFNNIGFDYPVIHYLLNNKDASAKLLHLKANEIIKAENKWEHVIKDKDCFIPQIDLFKIHHYDNKAKSTSLKMLEFNMRSDNIEDLPYDPMTELTSEQIDNLLKYNKHDMLQTFLFYEKSKAQIEFREELTKKYKRNFMNANDTAIGKDFFVMRLEEEMPNCCYGKNRKVKQTIRDKIDLGECLFDYVEFDRPEFRAIKEWFSKQVITETKGVFSDLLESDLGDVAKYANLRQKNKKLKGKPSEEELVKLKQQYPLCWIEERELKSGNIVYYVCWNVADTLNVVVDGFQFDFGVGGIHGSIESSIVQSDEHNIIIDQDVASYYPNLAIKNRVYPEHLSESFCDIYEDVYNQRKQLKKEGKDTEQQMMKLALNGTYGASNDQYSPFYDPVFTMKITINGQLSLCMLAEKLLTVEGLNMIQINTDGLTFKVPKKYQSLTDEICREWELKTQLELEGVEYNRMFIRDVNNYISEKFDGSLKNKGAYEWKDLPLHKNQSALVIRMAAENYLTKGVDVESFIRNHDNKFDFMLRSKVPRSSKLVGVDEFMIDQPLQNICRYYISNNGLQLVKIMPPVEEERVVRLYKGSDGEDYFAYTEGDIRKYEKKPKTSRGKSYEFIKEYAEKCPNRRIGIDTEWKVTVCNDINNFKGDINYDYYIQECKKLVEL